MIASEMPDDPIPSRTVSKIAKIPVSYLPKGVLIGDTVQLVVENIEGDTATLMVPEGLNKGEVQNADEEGGEDATAAAPGGNDTSVLLGPMNGLKNYLQKKSQDSSAAGRY